MITLSQIKTHFTYVAIILIGVVCGRLWLKEHDVRVLAEQQVKVSEAQIKTLQAQAVTQVAALHTHVVAVKTVPQAIAEIPELTNLPINARAVPDSRVDVTVAWQPLLASLEHGKECDIQLTAETAIVAQKNVEITSLKKKPSFFSRVRHVAEAVGVGIAIGALIK